MLTFAVSPVIPECISRKILISIARTMWYLSSYLGFVLHFFGLAGAMSAPPHRLPPLDEGNTVPPLLGGGMGAGRSRGRSGSG